MDEKFWLDGSIGVVVGDVLGLPVQFTRREESEKDPVTNMVEYRTFDMLSPHIPPLPNVENIFG